MLKLQTKEGGGICCCWRSFRPRKTHNYVVQGISQPTYYHMLHCFSFFISTYHNLGMLFIDCMCFRLLHMIRCNQAWQSSSHSSLISPQMGMFGVEDSQSRLFKKGSGSRNIILRSLFMMNERSDSILRLKHQSDELEKLATKIGCEKSV